MSRKPITPLFLLTAFLLLSLSDSLVEAGMVARHVPGEQQRVKLGLHTVLQLRGQGGG